MRRRTFGFRIALRVLLCGILLLVGPHPFLFGQSEEKRKVTEVFHVSRAGQVGAAETRETLLALYDRVAKSYNERIRKEQKKNPQVFKGERIRVIKRLGEQDTNGPLFVVAYDGGPSVMAIRGKAGLSPGELTPPLIITEAGQHTSEITRKVRVKDKNQKNPTLEVVDENQGDNTPTFFGIPIDRGDGPSTGKGNPSKKGRGNRAPSYKTVTESKTLKKFSATVSKERLHTAPPQMSKDLFVKKLKNGEVFSVSQTEQRRCRECIGFGRVVPKVGARDADGKVACPLCKELGKLQWDVRYQIFW